MFKSFEAVIFCLSLMVTSCSFNANEITQFAMPYEDQGYSIALTNATRSADIFRNFETKYLIRTTYLSPDFRKAMSDRVQMLYEQTQSSFGEAQTKVGFFVSIFGPESEKIDLDDQKLWSVIVETKNFRSTPIMIRKLKDKRRWQAFFPYVDKWSSEYFVLFDHPSFTPSAENLVEKVPLRLTFSNSDAKVVFTW